MKKVLITGATGFIGRQAIPPLLEKGYEIHAVSSQRSPIQLDGVTWHLVNLFDYKAVEEMIDLIRPSHLLHFAWIASPGVCWNSTDNLSWVEASLHLIRTFASNGGKRVMVSGTCAEYDWNQSVYSESVSVFRSATLYGTCKRSLYQILETFSQRVHLSFCWGYIFHLLGPYENPNRFVPSIIRGLLLQKEVACSHGTQLRDFLDVRDVADAFAYLLDTDIQGGVNIGSGNGITLKDITKKISAVIGNEHLLKFGAFIPPAAEPSELIPDTTRLNHEAGWEPKIPLNESLEEAIKWWKNNL
jgi:nucleoside-diphosphate-sugar epimerase